MSKLYFGPNWVQYSTCFWSFAFWGRCLCSKELNHSAFPSAVPLKNALDCLTHFVFSFPFPHLFFIVTFSIHHLSFLSFPSLAVVLVLLLVPLALLGPFHFTVLISLWLSFLPILHLLSPREMRRSWCTLHWLISATWPWPRPWRWDLGEIPMGLLVQARLSQSKPLGGCLDGRCWCLTVMRYKDS